jgi:hypothetical protein
MKLSSHYHDAEGNALNLSDSGKLGPSLEMETDSKVVLNEIRFPDGRRELHGKVEASVSK